MSNLDELDQRLLKLLQHDSTLTHKELAQHLNLTTTPVYERVKRLEREGFIRKYVALADKNKLDKTLMAYCHLSLKDQSKAFMEKFEGEVTAIPEVVECYHIAGDFDYMLKVLVKDMAAYQLFIVERLGIIENIAKAQSFFVLSEVLYETAIPI
jgi:Lrp/AsnC family leucine-responsive transcriptional regulator